MIRSRLKKKLLRAAGILLFIYLTGGLILYLVQDLLLFHPTRLPPDHEFSFTRPFREESFMQNGSVTHYIRFMADGEKKGTVLFFHGNMQHAGRYFEYSEIFTSRGYEVWMPDYPGFGKSTGRRTEKRIQDDAIMIHRLAVQEGSGKIIIYGKSIGTGVASYLSSRAGCHSLVLETPYYSINALAAEYFPIYPVSLLTRFSFPVHEYLGRTECPVLILHGTADEIIPISHARRLEKISGHIRLVPVSGGKHNGLLQYPEFRKSLAEILDD